MKKLFLACSALLLSVIIAVGCGSQVVEFPADSTADAGADVDASKQLCDEDTDCTVGSVCQNGECVVVDPCDGVTCPEGNVCQNGECVPTDPCEGVTCPEGSECKDGACNPKNPCEGVTCPDNGKCEDGQCPDPCANGKCDSGGPKDPCAGVCCPDDKECKQGKCVPKDPCAGVCCPSNKECKAGKCVPKDPCAGVQCPPSRVCKEGQCVCAGDDPDDNNRCGRNKTLICHKDCKGKRHNLCVSDNAVPAHKRHGDKVGDCSVCK